MNSFEAIRQKHRALAQKLFPELMAQVDWSADKLRGHRHHALQDLLALCKKSSPWHSDRLKEIEPVEFKLTDLPTLKPMGKHDLMANFDDIVTQPDLTLQRCENHIASGKTYLDGQYSVFASGGSSGVRAISIFGFEEMAINFVLGRRFMMRWAKKTGALQSNAVSASIGAAPGAHGTHHLSKIFGGGDENTYSVTQPIREIADGLNAAQPNILVVYSSYIPRLIEAQEKRLLRIHPQLVIASAEPISDEHARLVDQAWNCPVFSSWGATETGLLGSSSGFDPGLMLYDDHVIIEPVDREGNAVPPGIRADKLYITPLFHTILPVLRYEITDQLTVLKEPNRCSSSFTRTSFVEGRMDDWFYYGNGVVIHPHLFRTVLGQEKDIIEYQVIQTENGASIFSVCKQKIDEGKVIRQVSTDLETAGVESPQVTIKQVEWIKRIGNATKLKRFVPLPRAS